MTKKIGHSKIWVDRGLNDKNVCGKKVIEKRSFRNFAFEMCSAEFSLKHALVNEFLEEAPQSELKRKAENSKEWSTWNPGTCLKAEH